MKTKYVVTIKLENAVFHKCEAHFQKNKQSHVDVVVDVMTIIEEYNFLGSPEKVDILLYVLTNIDKLNIDMSIIETQLLLLVVSDKEATKSLVNSIDALKKYKKPINVKSCWFRLFSGCSAK
jgi:hypothetical protein